MRDQKIKPQIKKLWDNNHPNFIKEKKQIITKIAWVEIWCWIDLLSWTTSLALLTDLRNWLIFWLYHESTDWLVSKFSILFIQQDSNGRWYCLKQKYLIIFPGSVQASVIIRISSSFCSRYKHNYLPQKELWNNRL